MNTVGTPSSDTLEGSEFDDTLVGVAGSDALYGLDGADWLDGGAAADAVYGGLGLDTLFGTAGDSLYGGGDNDDFRVGEAAAVIDGGDGFDRLYITKNFNLQPANVVSIEQFVAAGASIINFSTFGYGVNLVTDAAAPKVSVNGSAFGDNLAGGQGNDTLNGGVGADTLLGGAGNDSLAGNTEADLVFGGAGNDTLTLHKFGGADTLDGGDGVDLANVDVSNYVRSLWIDLTYDGVEQRLFDGTIVRGVEQIRFTSGGGDDILVGGGLSDSLYGGAGADKLGGGAGDDILSGGAGDDTIGGGAGFDTAVFTGKAEAYQIATDAWGRTVVTSVAEGVDVLTNIQRLQFSDGVYDIVADPLLSVAPDALLFGVSPNGEAGMIGAYNLPDASGATPGTGFTNTGLTRAPDGTWWLGNDGRSDEADTTAQSSIVHLSADFSTKLGEVLLSSFTTVASTIQGVAYRTADDTVMFTNAAQRAIRLVTPEGQLVKTLTLPYAPNGLAYDSILDAAIVGRTETTAQTMIIEWRSLTNGALIKSLIINANPDHLFFDADRGEQGTLYVTVGKNGMPGFVIGFDVETAREIGYYYVPGANAIEGVFIDGDKMWIGNDAYYHNAAPQINRVLEFEITPLAETISASEATGPVTVDLTTGVITEGLGHTLIGVERAVFSGSHYGDLFVGGDWADAFSGFDGADTASGGGGMDFLAGGAGDDFLFAGAGVDSLDGGDGDDVLQGGSQGDRLLGGVGYDTVSYAGSSAVTVNLLLQTATGADADGDTLISIEGAIGSSFNDTFMGGGNSNLAGGLGNDRYTLAVSDTVIEALDEGTDTIRTASASYDLPDNVEILQFIGAAGTNFRGTGNEVANMIYGGSGNDTLDGSEGSDSLYGGVGNDTYIIQNVGDVIVDGGGSADRVLTSLSSYTLGSGLELLSYASVNAFAGYGNTLNNIITGGIGDDTLNGYNGVDTLVGGDGNDTYYVDAGMTATSTGDVVVETAGGAVGGIDLVISSVTFALGDNLENLQFIGTASATGVGNELGNLMTGNSANNTLQGRGGDDTLSGGGGIDGLSGGQGADLLIGGAGTDRFIISAGEAQGDHIEDFERVAGSSFGDQIRFSGYGAGSLTYLGDEMWSIHSALGGSDETIQITGVTALTANDDYFFT